MESELLIFSGNANRELANKICQYLDVPLGTAFIGRFSDGETRIEIESNVRGRDVFIIQPTCAPTNENVMELLIMIDALRRASALRITAVIPYYGYSRQERKSAPRTPITAKLIADLLVSAGVNRILTIELHTGAIQGFFNLPVDHLFSKPVFVEHFTKMNLKNIITVSPDAGGVERARALAKVLGCGLAIVDKRRDRPGVSQVMNLIGDVKDKTAILVDDICDTAGSLTSAAAVLSERGAVKVYAAITHGVLSGPAISRLNESCIEKLFITDTIPLSEEAMKCSKIEVLSVSELLGKAIRRIHNSDSISNLFI
ncbi:ribose-phosphate pyrophosphokinase [Fluviispira multicolorata]|uniref:Ribose-phosphate pyrophosphokinase n=1 Tax=Fluviispira multicolorata TaxID=2654512 RepID=A0A833JES3_9BACT|nr:ribose-phosphate pyrophosphokinase [Fluviispira multicolorata]KAB8033351.1 ribose-phosphate diphosphokinase [Fluviispira multicolorata]